jgi:hypothetical protein
MTMTSSNGTQGNGLDGQHVPIAGSEAQSKRVRRSLIALCAVVLAGASAVFAVMMLTAAPSSSAPGQHDSGSGGMPGMNHGAGQMPASTPSSTSSGDMPRMELVSAEMAVSSTSFAMSGDMPGMSQDGGHGSAPSPTMSGDMPGMDHGPVDVPATSPSSTMSGDMPGMDHGPADAPATSPTPTMSGDMPGMDHGSTDAHGGGTEHGDTAEVATDRPLAPVLGTFGGASSAVMLSAAFLRRKDRALGLAKQAARAARKAQK